MLKTFSFSKEINSKKYERIEMKTFFEKSKQHPAVFMQDIWLIRIEIYNIYKKEKMNIVYTYRHEATSTFAFKLWYLRFEWKQNKYICIYIRETRFFDWLNIDAEIIFGLLFESSQIATSLLSSSLFLLFSQFDIFILMACYFGCYVETT